jgi:hypothetical protein
MAAEAPVRDTALDLVLEYAALSGAFDPSLALAEADVPEQSALAMLASRLAVVCDTHPAGAETAWVMLTPERRKVLRRLQAADRVGEAVARRRRAAPDPETESLLQAIMGQGEYDPKAAETLALQPSPPREQVERMIVALDRAGEIAPAYPALPVLRGALARLDQQRRLRELNDRGLVLGEGHRAVVEQWLERRFTTSPVRMLYIAGPPGTGKSVLLETSVQAASAGVPPILVRLDFERPGLDVLDEVGLTAEVARQVANETGGLGSALLTERLRSVSLAGASAEAITARRFFPQELAAAIGRTVEGSGREVLLLLDTLDALRARGDTHPLALFRWIDRLVDAGLRPVRILAAGRGDPLPAAPGEPDRIGARIDVEALDEAGVERLLDRLAVPVALRSAIVRLARGNPLILRIASEVAQKVSTEIGGAQAGEAARTHLYRILIARIEDDTLKRLLTPGLILGTINAELLHTVVAPALGLDALPEGEAKRLFEALEKETWLVQPDPYAPGFVRLSGAMRSVLVPLLYGSLKVECARIDSRAARWFAKQNGVWFQSLALYHRLQRMRVGPPPAGLSPQMALTLDDGLLDDLPPRAQDLVRRLRGDRTSQLRGGGNGADDAASAHELMGIVERQDWNEGNYAAEQLTRGGGVDFGSQAGDALRALWWRSGQWRRARDWMTARERLSGRPADAELRDLPPLLALVRLEMEAEFAPARLARRIAAEPWLAGLVSDLARSAPDEIARSGALAFVVAAATDGAFLGSEARGGDVAGAVFNFFGQRLRRDGQEDLRRTLGKAHEMMTARGGAAGGCDFEPPTVARMLAALTPYAPIALNLAIQPDYHWLSDWAAASDAKLAAAGALLPWPAEVRPNPREHPILSLAGLGLFAEWAQAAAWLGKSRDLRLIGRSAEAWRQTVAGHWRYGTLPSGWSPAVTDVTLRFRLERLMEDEDPAAAAIAQLGLWSGSAEPDGDRVWARIGARATRTGDENAARHLGRLVRNRMPGGFAPAAAILAEGPRGT